MTAHLLDYGTGSTQRITEASDTRITEEGDSRVTVTTLPAQGYVTPTLTVTPLADRVHVKSGASWQSTEVFINVSDAWQSPRMYVKQNDIWQRVQ